MHFCTSFGIFSYICSIIEIWKEQQSSNGNGKRRVRHGKASAFTMSHRRCRRESHCWGLLSFQYAGVGNVSLLHAARYATVHVRHELVDDACQGQTQPLRNYMNDMAEQIVADMMNL